MSFIHSTIRPILSKAQIHSLGLATNVQRRRSLVKTRIPQGAWDSHMHVFDPIRYPLPPKALYTPIPSTTQDAIDFEASFGISNIVLVQPSCYGNSNSCMLETLEKLGPQRARAVVMFDPSITSQEQLQKWHNIGVRGVRINLQSVGKTLGQDALQSTLQTYADAVRPLDWVVQIYVPLAMVSLLEDMVPKLNVRVCIDHIGHPSLENVSLHGKRPDPYDLVGFSSLIALLKAGNTFVKLSGAYRFSHSPKYEDVEPLVREILKVAGKNRAVFSTDWPHTRYEGLDITPWVECLLDWCDGDSELINAVFRDTAVELWGIKASS